MQKNNTNNAVRYTRIAVAATAALLCLILLAVALVSCFNTSEVSPKEEILGRIDTVIAERDYSTVCDYLTEFGLEGFNKAKFKAVEECFDIYCVMDLPSVEAMAKETATLFCEHLYDETDKENREEFTDALLYCYVAATGDDYAVYRTADEYENFNSDMSGDFVGIGVSVLYDRTQNTITVQEVMPDSPAKAAGILPGDLIYAVNGETLEDIDYYTMVNNIKGEEGTSVEITLIRDGEYVVVNPIRAHITETSVTYSVDSVTKVAYVRITSFKDNTVEQFAAAMNGITDAGAVGVVFDLRDNPGGYLHSVVNILSMLVPKDTPVVSYKYAWETESTVMKSEYDGHLDIPAVVIANANTASAGEIFTAALKDYNDMGLLEATVVGVTTFGKGIMQSTVPISDGSTVTLTTAFYNPPTSPNYHEVGVEPDCEITAEDEGDVWYTEAVRVLGEMLN